MHESYLFIPQTSTMCLNRFYRNYCPTQTRLIRWMEMPLLCIYINRKSK